MKQMKQIAKVVKFIQTTIKLKKLWVDLGMSFKLPGVEEGNIPAALL